MHERERMDILSSCSEMSFWLYRSCTEGLCAAVSTRNSHSDRTQHKSALQFLHQQLGFLYQLVPAAPDPAPSATAVGECIQASYEFWEVLLCAFYGKLPCASPRAGCQVSAQSCLLLCTEHTLVSAACSYVQEGVGALRSLSPPFTHSSEPSPPRKGTWGLWWGWVSA